MTETPVASWGCRTDDILLAHAVFRRLFALLPGAIRSVGPGDRRRARVVSRRLAMATGGLHHHHETEDAKLWDALQGRAPGCALHVALMRTQHARVAAMLEDVDRLARWWRVDADPVVRDRLADRAESLAAALETHLRDEESKVLPVVERVMSQLEWDAVGEAARSDVDPKSAFVMLGLMVNSGTPAQRAELAAHVPATARVLYDLFGHLQYERAMADLGAPVAPVRRRGSRLGGPAAT